MATFHLKIVTPEKEIFDDQVDMVTVPSSTGSLGILPHHVNLVAKLVPGELKITKGNQETFLAAGEGFVQVANNTVSVLTDLAKNATEIDEAVVEEARKRAKEALAEKLTDEEYATTLAALEKSLAQLKVKRKYRHLN